MPTDYDEDAEYFAGCTFLEPEDVKLTIEASFPDNPKADWFSLSREGHDGRMWDEAGVSSYSKLPVTYLCTSQRLHRRTCVEGPSYEWAEMANAIESGVNVDNRRCGLVHRPDGIGLYSPRNSNGLIPVITKESAAYLAVRIREVIAEFAARNTP